MLLLVALLFVFFKCLVFKLLLLLEFLLFLIILVEQNQYIYQLPHYLISLLNVLFEVFLTCMFVCFLTLCCLLVFKHYLSCSWFFLPLIKHIFIFSFFHKNEFLFLWLWFWFYSIKCIQVWLYCLLLFLLLFLIFLS